MYQYKEEGSLTFLQKKKANGNYFQKEAELLQEGIFILIHLFARDVLVMKKSWKSKKLSPIFIISVLKVE